jgi:hypothetical protein
MLEGEGSVLTPTVSNSNAGSALARRAAILNSPFKETFGGQPSAATNWS